MQLVATNYRSMLIPQLTYFSIPNFAFLGFTFRVNPSTSRNPELPPARQLHFAK